jgi:hypothetical protein
MTKRERMRVAERVIASLTDMDGRLDLAAARNALADEYRADPDLLDPDAQAAADVTAVDRARRPQPSQDRLFEKSALVPLGESRRVEMGKATLEDLDAWWLVEVREHVAHSAAHQRKAEYIASRRAAWQETDTCLLDVEQRLS